MLARSNFGSRQYFSPFKYHTPLLQNSMSSRMSISKVLVYRKPFKIPIPVDYANSTSLGHVSRFLLRNYIQSKSVLEFHVQKNITHVSSYSQKNHVVCSRFLSVFVCGWFGLFVLLVRAYGLVKHKAYIFEMGWLFSMLWFHIWIVNTVVDTW